jgi:two-component system sensor histidine kinase/response regulator
MAQTLRLLIADDEEGMRLGVRRALRDFVADVPHSPEGVRFEVDDAASGEEALDKIASAPPDILLLDYKMPGMSGLDVLERLSHESHDIATVMITAYASIETAIMATKRGAFDYLPKPFTPDELRGIVRKTAHHLILQRQARELENEKRRVRFQFISVLAHELKAPLAAIEGYLNLMGDAEISTDPAAMARMIERSMIRVEGMRKMIFDLLDLTRIEAGSKKRDVREIDLAEVARMSIETVLPDALKRTITIELHPEGVALPMHADHGEIEIVLNNLISNAVKYNRESGRVDVTLERDGDFVKICVADTGFGLTPEEAGKLFQDFVRIKNQFTKGILGSGLGLATVKKIALLYEGDATVQSERDKGSVFTVTLCADTPLTPVEKEPVEATVSK